MFMQSGGGGKGTRLQAAHQQNHSQHHQTSQQQQQHHQQSRNLHVLPADQQPPGQQQAPPHGVFVAPLNSGPNHNNHHNHPLPHALQQRDNSTQQAHQAAAVNVQQQQQQHLSHHNREQHHQLQPPLFFYSSQPHPTAHFGGHAPHSSGSSNGSGGALQLSASGTTMQHAANNPALTHAGSNTSLVRVLSNPSVPHFTQSAGLITAGGANAAAGNATYVTTAYMPFNQPGPMLGAPSVTFQPNGNNGQQTSAFYAAIAAQQKQLHAAGQQHAAAGLPTNNAGAVPTQAIAFYHQPGVPNNANSTGSLRPNMRVPRPGTPQPGNYFTTYAVPTGAQPRAQLVGNTAGGVPTMLKPSTALRGSATFHMQPQFGQPIAMGPTGPTPLIAGTTMPGVNTPPSAVGLHSFAAHIQNNAVTGGFSAPTGSPHAITVSGKEKVKERRHAIPIIHPDTNEVVHVPNSSVFVMKDTSTTAVSAAGTLTENAAGVSESPVTMCLYNDPILIETPSSSSLLSATKVDYQMQTDKPLPPSTEQAVMNNDNALSNENMANLPNAVTASNNANENHITSIVKDILTSSNNAEEQHLSFWQYSDVEFGAEKMHSGVTAAGLEPDALAVERTYYNKEPLPQRKQRPKSVNKQSTATPTSIANAVAEAATTGGDVGVAASGSITILSRSQPLPQAAAVKAPPQSPNQQHRAAKTMISIATTAVPHDRDTPPGRISPAALSNINATNNESGGISPTKKSGKPAQQQVSQSKTYSSATSSSSAASSSAASTPTHQLLSKLGGKPVISQSYTAPIDSAFISPATMLLTGQLSSTPGTTPPSSSTGNTANNNKKNQRKAKRAKEQDKKKQKAAATCNNYNNNNSSKGGTPINTEIGNSNGGPNVLAVTSTTFATTTKTTAAVVSTAIDKAAKLPTDKLSATSNNSTISSSLRDIANQQQHTTNEQTPTPPALNEQPHTPSFDAPAPDVDKAALSKKEVAKLLQSSRASTPQPDTEAQNLQFLNSSSSVCEEEEPTSAHRVEETAGNQSAIGELKFGDFSEEKLQDSSFICSSTWSSSSACKLVEPDVPTGTLVTAVSVSATTLSTSAAPKTTKSADHVDCAPKVKGSNKKISPVLQAVSKHGSIDAVPQNAEKSEATIVTADAARFYKYSIEELRDISKSSEAHKPPTVLCQKGDCIAQLFVSRQQQQHHQNHGQHVHQYQHMNFNESMDYVSGKRGRGHGHNQNKKHHEHQQTGAGSSNQRQDIIRVQLSLKEEIKLSECENAWQPDTLRRKSVVSNTAEEDDIEAVLKKVRGILNKLTPDNFKVLLKEMSSIQMDSEAKMTKVMLLIFEKTVSEPNFAPTYARFCKVLFHEIKAENKSLFTSSLIIRIQHEFESNVNDANAKAQKLQPTLQRMNECSDPKKKAELRAEMEDMEYQFRRRAWGTVRFIGELYKLQSLNSDRVLICIESLLEHGCEEKLEYMCKLLTTVGHLLEGGNAAEQKIIVRNDKIFRKIQDIVNKSRGTSNRQPSIKISSRVRFMMQDVLDLRGRHWDQPISSAARPRSHNANASVSGKNEEKQHGRGGNMSNSNSGGGGQQKQHSTGGGGRYQDGSESSGNYFMQKMQKPNQHETQAVTNIDLTKLSFSSGGATTHKLGNSSLYQWRNENNRPTNTTTTPAAVSSMTNVQKRTPGQTITYSPYPAAQQSAGGGSKTNLTGNNAGGGGSGVPAGGVASLDMPLTNQQCQNIIILLVDEALNTRNWMPEVLKLWRTYHANQQASVFYYLLMDYLHLGTVKSAQRLACANVFIYLMRQNAFDKATFAQVYTSFGEDFPDLLVDVPNGWTYVFEFLGPMMHERLLGINDVWQRRWLEDSYFTDRFVRAFLNYFVSEFGAGYARNLWHNEYKLGRGQMFWTDAQKYRELVQSSNFSFLEQNGSGGSKQPTGQQQYTNSSTTHPKLTRSAADHVGRIAYLLSLSNDCDMAIDYINTNVYINNNFVRQLTKFLCCDYALTVILPQNNNNSSNYNNSAGSDKPGLHLNVEQFERKCTPLLRLCLDTQESHEIACINEIVDTLQQHYLSKIEGGLPVVNTIWAIFTSLYDSEIIPRESFEKWYNSENVTFQSTAHRGLFMEMLHKFIKKL